jgi:hypothetical protein
MARIIILAGRLQEANAYARAVGIHPSRYTAPVSAASIDGVAPSEVHILPGFRRRRDTHAIMAAVKRSLRKYQSARVLEIDERGPLTERKLVVAHRYNALLDAGIPEDVDPAIAMASVEFTPEDVVAEQTGAENWKAELDKMLEPEGWEPPESLTASEVINLAANPDARGADILAAKPKPRKPRAPKAPLPEIFE